MAITEISPTGDAAALDWYLGKHPAKDAGEERGFGKRVEFVSTIGNCSPETYVADVVRTETAHRQKGLKHTTWHMIISWSHEEADPFDEVAGAERHRVGMEIAKRAFPGRQIKGVTQRDNGRWEGEGADRVWVPGKWHTHLEIAHVSELAAVVPCSIKGPDGKHRTVMRRVPAGRALNGTQRNIVRLRAITDEVVLEKLGYDNAAYVKACGRPAVEVTREDIAQRAKRGYSNHDALRERLDVARGFARSWDEYVEHAATDDIDVKMRGKGGVSYAWADEEGEPHIARARALGDAYTKAGVERFIGHGGVPPAPPPHRRTKPIDDAQAARHPEYAGVTYEDLLRERIDVAVAESANERAFMTRDDLDLAVGVYTMPTPDGPIAVADEHLGRAYVATRVMDELTEKEKEQNHDRSNERSGGASASEAKRAEQSAQRLRAAQHAARLRDEDEDRRADGNSRSPARDAGHDERSTGDGGQREPDRQGAGRGSEGAAVGGRELVDELEAGAAGRSKSGTGLGDLGYGDD